MFIILELAGLGCAMQLLYIIYKKAALRRMPPVFSCPMAAVHRVGKQHPFDAMGAKEATTPRQTIEVSLQCCLVESSLCTFLKALRQICGLPTEISVHRPNMPRKDALNELVRRQEPHAVREGTAQRFLNSSQRSLS